METLDVSTMFSLPDIVHGDMPYIVFNLIFSNIFTFYDLFDDVFDDISMDYIDYMYSLRYPFFFLFFTPFPFITFGGWVSRVRWDVWSGCVSHKVRVP